MSTRRVVALAVAGALVAGGSGAAIAAVTRDDAQKSEQAVLDDAAKRLDVTPQRLRDALSAAQDDRLDQAVRDGKLTREQADAIKARRKSSGRVLGGPFGGPHGFRGHGPGPFFGARRGIVGDLARALGVTRAQLRTQLREGKSIADIAKAQGKSLDDVRAALKADAREGIDAAVKHGELTQAQGDRLLAHVDEMLEHLDDAPRLRLRHGGGRPG